MAWKSATRRREYHRAYARIWRKRHPEKQAAYDKKKPSRDYEYTPELYAKTRASRLKSAFRYKLKSKYSLTVDQYLKMLADQDGRCAICRTKFREGYWPQVDHDHKTRKVRGLLCIVCNTCLRAIDRDRNWGMKALEYLGG